MLIVLIESVLGPESLLPQSPPRPDNLTVMQRLFDEVAERVIGNVRSEPEAPVVIAPAADPASPAYLWRARLVKLAMDQGRSVFAKDSTIGAPRYFRIDYQVLACGVDYDLVRRGWLWKKKVLQRKVAVEVDIEIIEQPSGRISLHEGFRAAVADTLRASELSQLDNPTPPFAVGRSSERADDANILEPVLLTLAAGAAIYALYSLRSR
jgi:hypothetical protein